MQNRPVRSAVRDRDLRWSNRQIHYAFDSSVSSGLQTNIRTAMNTIERQTCLRFFHRSNQRDYILFTSHSDDGCSSYVGRQGSSQEITLGPGCNNVGIIIHEIGHALGLWHEQSRPDRDGYVRIITSNIQSGRGSQFNKRNSYEAENQGTTYDYGSVMHYRRNEFSSNGFDTIEIINTFEYNRQGRPVLGAPSKTELSSADATQLNRMYNCPGSGVPGILKVYVKYGRGLPDRDGWFAGDSDPYVRVTAVDDRSQQTTQRTQYIQGNENPNWYRWLDFGGRISWQYFEMSTWDNDWGSDDKLLDYQTFTVSSGYHSNIQHCQDSTCSARVVFDYHLILDGNECSPNPCVRGTCTDLISDYRCNCPSGYGGRRCELARGRLRIFARYGSGLPDRDGWLAGDSDPYVRVIAYASGGGSRSLRTGDDRGDDSPEWNQWLDFGVDNWSRFTVQVYDEDPGSDDSLSSVSTYYISSYITRTYVRKNCDSGYIYFDYYFQP